MRHSPLWTALVSVSLVSAQIPTNDTISDATTPTAVPSNTTSTDVTSINGTISDAATLSSICVIPDGSYCDPTSTTLIYYCDEGVATSTDCADDLGDTSATCFTPTSVAGDAYCVLPDGAFPPVQDASPVANTTATDSAALVQQDVSPSAVQNTASSASSVSPADPQAAPTTILSPDATKNETVVNHNAQLPANVQTLHPGSSDPSASIPKARPDDYAYPPACGAPPIFPVPPPGHPETGPTHPDTPSTHPETPSSPQAPAPHAQPSQDGSRSGPPAGGPPAGGPPASSPSHAGGDANAHQGDHHDRPTGPSHQPSGAAMPSGWHKRPDGVAMPSGIHMRPTGGFAKPSGGFRKPDGEGASKPSEHVEGSKPSAHAESGRPAPPAFTPPIIPDNRPAAASSSVRSSSKFYTMPSPTVTAAPSSAGEFSPTFTGAGAVADVPGHWLAVFAIVAGIVVPLF